MPAVDSTGLVPPAATQLAPYAMVRPPVASWVIVIMPDCPGTTLVGVAKVKLPVSAREKLLLALRSTAMEAA